MGEGVALVRRGTDRSCRERHALRSGHEPPFVPRRQRHAGGHLGGRRADGGAVTDPASAETLPAYAPIPPSALGPAVNAQGDFVGRVEQNLYWATDGTYQAAFLTTGEGVVLFDPPRASGTTCSGRSTRSPPPTLSPTR
jgi:hypothetical protein